MDKIKVGDIIVCMPGFTGGSGSQADQKYGGAGYVDGQMLKSKDSSDGTKPLEVHWGFKDGAGVFARALRLATEEEIEGFHWGFTNIYQFSKYSFTISYLSKTGEIKKLIIEAVNESEALKTIKDLQSINYIMSSK